MSIKKRFMTALCAATALTSLTTLGACVMATRHDTAASIARNADMLERIIPTDPFNLTVWERFNRPGTTANVYIEGDGMAWLGKHRISLNPTPKQPLALELAAIDNADNVVYIARPCQYTGLKNTRSRGTPPWNGKGACPDRYWTSARTSSEVVRSASQALDSIKAFYPITGFNLIGYSGGAALAILVASERKDIVSIRTVAGNTNYGTMWSHHGVTPLSASRRPEDVALKIMHIPQQHFIGSRDLTVPPKIFNDFEKASGGPNACIRATLVTGATHEKGWIEKWTELLRAPLDCNVKQ